MSEGAARAALQQVEEVWPDMRPNKIRIVGPPAGWCGPGKRRRSGIAPRIARSATRRETFDQPKRRLPIAATRGRPIRRDRRRQRQPAAPRADRLPR